MSMAIFISFFFRHDKMYVSSILKHENVLSNTTIFHRLHQVNIVIKNEEKNDN